MVHVYMRLRGYVDVCMCHWVSLFVYCLFVCARVTVDENYTHWFKPLLIWNRPFELLCRVKCIDMVYVWVNLIKIVIGLHFKPILYPMYDSYIVTTCPAKILTTYPMVVLLLETSGGTRGGHGGANAPPVRGFAPPLAPPVRMGFFFFFYFFFFFFTYVFFTYVLSGRYRPPPSKSC